MPPASPTTKDEASARRFHLRHLLDVSWAGLRFTARRLRAYLTARKAEGENQALPTSTFRASIPSPFLFPVLALSEILRSSDPQILRFTSSERKLRRELDDSTRDNCLRLQPGSTRNECVVVGQHCARVQRVVEVGANQRPRATEPQHLAHPEVELVDAVAVHLSRRQEIDRYVRNVACRNMTKRLLDH